LAVVAAVLAAMLAWRLMLSAMWRAAEREVAAHLPLGSDGIIRGAQSIYHGGHPRAALLLHGLGDTPQSLRTLASRLADAGWTVSAPLLPGHGRTLAQFSGSGAAEWINAAGNAYNELAREHAVVVVCGQSMGALIAIELAARLPLPSLVLLAPYIAMPPLARAVGAAWPLFQAVYPIMKTRDRRSIQDPAAESQSLGFGYATPRLLFELSQMVRHARRDLHAIRSATLVIYSREDNRVPPQEVVRALARIEHPVKAVHLVSGCGHVLTADYCKDHVATLVIEWLERSTSPHPAEPAAR
jgi:carboxylesterase